MEQRDGAHQRRKSSHRKTTQGTSGASSAGRYGPPVLSRGSSSITADKRRRHFHNCNSFQCAAHKALRGMPFYAPNSPRCASFLLVYRGSDLDPALWGAPLVRGTRVGNWVPRSPRQELYKTQNLRKGPWEHARGTGNIVLRRMQLLGRHF